MKSRVAALAAAGLLASCVETAPDSVLNGEAVLTQYAPGASFGQYATFSVDPQVVVVDETGAETTTFTVDGANLVSTISANMTERNFTEVAWRGDDTPADLHIKMHATLGEEDVYYAGYCGWYPYYYCYPGWSYAGSYNYGTVVLDMGDVKNAAVGGKLPLVWTAALYGILSSYYTPGGPATGSNVNWGRIQRAIDRAFDDSPYLTTAP